MGQQLSDVNIGQTVFIRAIEESVLKVKLMEMGLIEGKRLRVLFKAPLGDPIAVDVEGYVLSLRKDEAKLISVSSESKLAS